MTPIRTILCAMALAASPALADEFDLARDAWLAGEDMAALEALAALAAEGDADAQLLLGRIAGAAQYWPPEVAALPRRARNALLRAPGGLSGRSWIAVAAEAGDPLAAAFDAAGRPDAVGAALLDLLDAGETEAVASLWPGYVSGGDWEGALAVAQHPAAPEALSRWTEPLRAGLRGEVVRDVGPDASAAWREGIPWPDEALADPETLDAAGARLRGRPEAAPFAAACDAACTPEAADRCLGAMWASATDDPARAATAPVQSLVTVEAWRESPRAPSDAARAIGLLQLPPLDPDDPALLPRLSRCAAEAVQASSSASQ